MGFRLDRRFESLCAAFDYALDEYASKDHPVNPREHPAFIFRGECGRFRTTQPSIARVCDWSREDVLTLAKITDWIAARLKEEREDMTWLRAFGYLQHYGMPSRFVDFTGDLGRAFAFAGSGDSDVGRLAVMPYIACEAGPMCAFFDHPWAERAQRQGAFGMLMDPSEIDDLKCDRVRNRFGIKWYEFSILPNEREWCKQQTGALLQERNDASGGFVRYWITCYVEAFTKLSPRLTDWLLQHIPIAPYCARVYSHEGKDAVVFFQDAESFSTYNLPAFDRDLEILHSRRYWSAAYPDDSRQRVRAMPLSAEMFVDLRTYHSNG